MVTDSDINEAAKKYAEIYGKELFGDYMKAYKAGAMDYRNGKIKKIPNPCDTCKKRNESNCKDCTFF